MHQHIVVPTELNDQLKAKKNASGCKSMAEYLSQLINGQEVTGGVDNPMLKLDLDIAEVIFAVYRTGDFTTYNDALRAIIKKAGLKPTMQELAEEMLK